MNNSCEFYAEITLHKAKQNVPPIDIRRVAKTLDIAIEEKDGGNRYEGCLLNFEGERGIIINKAIKSETRKRFTLAHEIGHAEIPTHTSVLYQCSQKDIEFSFKQREQEREANSFAAALLMPQSFISEIVKNSSISLDAIRKISKQCHTSFISSAIRYIKNCPEPAALIVSEEGKIKFYCLSPNLMAKKIFELIPDSALVKGSIAHSLFEKQKETTLAYEDKGKINLNIWFPYQDYSKYDCFEHVISFPNYNRTISLVWLEEKYEDQDFILDDWEE